MITKRIEYIILDKYGKERNYTYSYSHAKMLAESTLRQTGKGIIRFIQDGEIIKEEYFM